MTDANERLAAGLDFDFSLDAAAPAEQTASDCTRATPQDKQRHLSLDKLAGEPLDMKVNGILPGQAEVVVVNDAYGQLTPFNNKHLSERPL